MEIEEGMHRFGVLDILGRPWLLSVGLTSVGTVL